MNPFLVMLDVLRHLLAGDVISARVTCSPCAGDSCGVCGGKSEFVLSSLQGPTPAWATEAQMIVDNCQCIAMTDPVIRRVIIPLVMANKILADEDRPAKRRIEAAREAASKCAAEDWRQLCLSWIDAVEKGTT